MTEVVHFNYYVINFVCLGCAKSLLNTNWLNLTMHFGMRGRQEHVQLLWGDILLKVDAEGTESLEFTERRTKTRQGASKEVRQYSPKMFATGKNV